MKKAIAAALTAVMALGIAGCSNNNTESSKASETTTVTESQTETSEETTTAETSETETETEKETETETTTEASETSEETSDAVTVPGTWQTVSIGAADDAGAPVHYVQFAAKEINYGKMKGGKFELEYSDKISRIEEISKGRFLVQAESSRGTQYTYRTAETDSDVMEYYASWNEDEFADTYSAGESLMKSVK